MSQLGPDRVSDPWGMRMTRRRLETVLAYATLGILAIYIPVETYVSLPRGLLSPYYLVDAIAMALLLWGAVHSLRARPRPAPEILCIGVAWAAANAWRATFDRLNAVRAGGTLEYGAAEIRSVATGLALALATLAVLLVLVAMNQRREK